MVKGQKYHILYKTICTATGNFYVGVHSTTNLEDGYLGSGKRLSNSIQKHGRENHVREILEFFKTREELMKREREVVNEKLLENEKCMNLKKGGEGGHIDDEHLQKMHRGATEWLNEKWKDQDYVRVRKEKTTETNKILHQKGILKAPNWNGRRHKRETLNKFSEMRKGQGTGSRNSQYGKVWIYNETLKKNFSISSDQLDSYLKNGWKKGRKMKF